MKKIWGALLAGSIVIIYYGILIGVIIYADFTSIDQIPTALLFVIIGAFLIPIVGVLIALLMRIEEIRDGEEEEAKKY